MTKNLDGHRFIAEFPKAVVLGPIFFFFFFFNLY